MLVQVTHACLQVLNELVRNNVDFQENACLVGLVTYLVLNFFSFMFKSFLLDVRLLLLSIFRPLLLKIICLSRFLLL